MKQRIAAVMAGLLLVALAAGAETGVSIPEKLKASQSEVLSLETMATGVQIYECGIAREAPGKFQWVFKAPEADLFDAAGKRVGKHYAGPTWESNDGSKVVAAVKARDDAPDAKSIPWLLLGAKSTAGTGVFGKTTSIQRVRTAGGTPPAEACSQAQAGKVARVAYEAVYYFYVPKP